MTVPTFRTSRLTLRPFSPDDASDLHEILLTPGILKYYPSTQPPELERVQKLVQRQIDHWVELGYGWWAVESNLDRKLIGWSGLQFLTETEEIEIGYLLNKPYWGKGLATESAQVGINFGFEQLGIQEIIGITHPENIASQRVLEKIGLEFQREAEYFGMDCFKYLISRPILDTD